MPIIFAKNIVLEYNIIMGLRNFLRRRKNEKFRVGLTSYMSMWYPIVKFPDFEGCEDGEGDFPE